METLSDQKTNYAICRCLALTSTYRPCHKILHCVDDQFAQKMKPTFDLLSQINQGDLPDIPDDVEWSYYLKAQCSNHKGYFQKANKYCDMGIEQAKGKVYEFLAPLAYLQQSQLRRLSNKYNEADDILNNLLKTLEEKPVDQLNAYFQLQIRCQKIFIQIYQISHVKSIERFGELEDILSKFQPGDHLLVLIMLIAKMEYAISMHNSHIKLYQEKKDEAFQEAAAQEKKNAKETAKLCKEIIKQHLKPSHKLYAYFYQVKFKIDHSAEYAEKLIEKFPIKDISNLYQILALRLPLITLREKVQNGDGDYSRVQWLLEGLQEKLNEYNAPQAKSYIIKELARIHYSKRADQNDFMHFIYLTMNVVQNEPACFKEIEKIFKRKDLDKDKVQEGFVAPQSLDQSISSGSNKTIPDQKEESHDASLIQQEESKEESKEHYKSISQDEDHLSVGNTINYQDSGINVVNQSQNNLDQSSMKGQSVVKDSQEEVIIIDESQISSKSKPLDSLIKDSADDAINEFLADGKNEPESQELKSLHLSMSEEEKNNESSNVMNETINDINLK